MIFVASVTTLTFTCSLSLPPVSPLVSLFTTSSVLWLLLLLLRLWNSVWFFWLSTGLTFSVHWDEIGSSWILSLLSRLLLYFAKVFNLLFKNCWTVSYITLIGKSLLTNNWNILSNSNVSACQEAVIFINSCTLCCYLYFTAPFFIILGLKWR